jgi:hypothetical protein
MVRGKEGEGEEERTPIAVLGKDKIETCPHAQSPCLGGVGCTSATAPGSLVFRSLSSVVGDQPEIMSAS